MIEDRIEVGTYRKIEKTEKGTVTGVEVIEVIRVAIMLGDGKDMATLFRPGFQYWSKDGQLLAEVDEHKPPEFEPGKAYPLDGTKPGGLRR
jgi:hypothetical protein